MFSFPGGLFSPMAGGVASGAGAASNFSMSLSSPGAGFNPNQVSTPYPSGYQAMNAQPQNALGFPGLAPSGPEVIFSGKHDGLCLYLGRILRWVQWRMRGLFLQCVHWLCSKDRKCGCSALVLSLTSTPSLVCPLDMPVLH